MKKLKPGLCASEDGKMVALAAYHSVLGEVVFREALPKVRRGGWLSTEEFTKRYPIRVVRCEVEDIEP